MSAVLSACGACERQQTNENRTCHVGHRDFPSIMFATPAQASPAPFLIRPNRVTVQLQPVRYLHPPIARHAAVAGLSEPLSILSAASFV